jgi:K+-transporting ATPase c subunit
MKIMTSAEIGTRLETVARAIAPALVFAYTAGLITGQWYRRITAALAAAHARWVGDAWRFDQPAHAPAAAKPQAPRVTATLHKAPLTVEALCKAHTQRELMAMAGTKSKRSKKFLAEKILTTK